MLQSYLKIALRNLWKNKIFTIINISGLALGLACALLIIFHVRQELSYDKGFSKADRIFRMTLQGKGEDARTWAATSYTTGEAMQQALPQVVNMVRFYRPYPFQVFSYTSADGTLNKFEEKAGFFADPTVTDVFDLNFVAGNKANALTSPGTIIITERMAQKYFGKTDPIGKILQDDVNGSMPLRVTGVVRDFSFPSHLQFDYLLSMSTIHRFLDDASLANRTWNGFYTYVVLDKASSLTKVNSRMQDVTARYYIPTGETREQIIADRQLNLQPISDIHLHSKLEKEMWPNSDITYVRIFSLAALFILLVAAVNFINLYTAQAFGRMKEIGMRKVVGATRKQLIAQFLGESLLTTLLAAIFALLLFKSVIPFYNSIASRPFYVSGILSLFNLGIIVLLIAFIGLLAGGYPAWNVARFHPVKALKGKGNPASSVDKMRKGLVIFQFVVSVFMIISTVIIYRQIRFFHDKDLGFDREQVAGVTIYGPMWPRFGALIDDIRQQSDITDFSVVSTLPGDRFSSQPFQPLAATEDEFGNSRIMWSDERLLSTLHIPLKEGRNFFNQMPDIKQKEFILNESAVKAYQLKTPIGQRFVLDRDTGTVVGIVKDFNFASLHQPVDPLVIKYDPYRANYLLLKIRPGRIKEALAFMEDRIKKLTPAGTFTYTFIDDKLNRLYTSENQMSTIFKAFAAFAIFISCMGLFGLSAYAAQLRTKEVSIRKVLGASSTYIALLLSRDFVKLVFVAILLSCPIAWWAMDKWLNGFAYRIPISGWMFVAAGIFALVVAMLTVSYQAIKVAMTNPVRHLKAD